MEQNPYAAPQSQVLQSSTAEEAIRREHINTEATIKSVGILYYLAAIMLIMVAIPNMMRGKTHPSVEPVVVGLVLILAGLGVGLVGHGLRKLRSWARIPTIIFACLGLFGFPVGTLINAYILVKVCGKQGEFVMTEEYQRIIAATPHIQRKTSIVVIILLVLLVLILIGAIAAVAFG